ncbi:MAG: hypothetical protein M1832_001449 [Thelocarpon impressellum]|nr:MAG: hypothetical protein M1832_001449 [Thelocarpon impressellum]
MLLTSGQISMTISSAVVFIFTSLLFLSGYILQQQTVRNLQSVIKPPRPARVAPVQDSAPIPALAALEFGDPPGSKGHSAFQSLLNLGGPPGGWKKMAHVQVVSDHMRVCSSIMLFADLHRHKSKAGRVLLYPKSWSDGEGLEDEHTDPLLVTSRRLLKAAAKRYSVVLRAVDSITETVDEKSLPPGALSHLFSLTSYNRILYLSAPGLLLNPKPLECLFSKRSHSPVAGLSDGGAPPHRDTSILLIQPSKDEHRRLLDAHRSDPALSSHHLLKAKYPTLNALLSSPAMENDEAPFFVRPSDLRAANTLQNATTFLSLAGFVHLGDGRLPGPEYDIPRATFSKASPEGAEARKVWDAVYSRFREERMDVCGLDLEPWRGL